MIEGLWLMKQALGRDTLIGCMIAGGFGMMWTLWAASGLHGPVAAVVRLSGVAVGTSIMGIATGLLRRSGPGSDGLSHGAQSASIFRSRGYVVTLAAELVALFAGNAVLNVSSHSEYVPVWTALVVGVHFIGLGHLFGALFHWVGGAFVAAAVIGGTVGASAGTTAEIEASTGLVAAASLFASGVLGLLASRLSDRAPAPTTSADPEGSSR